MKLQPVTPTRQNQVLLCCRCNKWTRTEDVFADIDGPAFKSYYCRTCVEEMQPKEEL